MKLSYQILKKLILEQVEINKDIVKLRGLAYDLSLKNLENLEDAKKLVDAYDIYQRALLALKKCEDEHENENKPKGECSQQPIIDYYEQSKIFRISTSQQRQALEKPDVFIRVNDTIGVRYNADHMLVYVPVEVFTYDTTSPDLTGIHLGNLNVYPASEERQVKGSFLGDEDFTLPYDQELFDDNEDSQEDGGLADWEILDWLNGKLDAWVRGEDEKQRKYIEFILNA